MFEGLDKLILSGDWEVDMLSSKPSSWGRMLRLTVDGTKPSDSGAGLQVLSPCFLINSLILSLS